MPSITKQVWNIIQSDAALQKDISRGLINTRALARYILKTRHLKASLDSVISAIRRFEQETGFREEEVRYRSLFRESVILTKNNVVCLTVSRQGNKFLSKLFDSRLAHEFLRVSTGSKSTLLVVDQSFLPDVEKIIPNKEIIKKEVNLSELNVFFKEEIIKTKGVLARIANEIALHNINIEEIIINPPEFLIYVKQKDILKTYESILKLRDESFS